MSYNPPPQGPPPSAPPPPPGYGYGGQPAIPAQVTTASVLLFVMGGLAILGGLILAAFASVSGLVTALAVISLLLGGVEIWLGVAVRQLKPWARTAALAVSGVVAVLQLISLISGGFLSIVVFAMAVVVIYMLSQKPVAEAFARSGR